MRATFRGLSTIAFASVLAMSAVGTMRASANLDFSGSGGTGTIHYGGGVAQGGGIYTGGSITGSGLLIQFVTGTGTGNDGQFPITSGVLSFTSGAITYDSTTHLYTMAAGGSFTITGSGPGGSGPTLVAGSFSASSQPFTTAAFFGDGTDTKDPKLLSFFVIPGAPPFDFMTFSIRTGVAATPAKNGAFTETGSFSTDFSNTAVPEPVSITLLGGVLLCSISALRRKLRKA